MGCWPPFAPSVALDAACLGRRRDPGALAPRARQGSRHHEYLDRVLPNFAMNEDILSCVLSYETLLHCLPHAAVSGAWAGRSPPEMTIGGIFFKD